MLDWCRIRGQLSGTEWGSGKGAVLLSHVLLGVSSVEWGSVEGAALSNRGFRDGTCSSKETTFLASAVTW